MHALRAVQRVGRRGAGREASLAEAGTPGSATPSSAKMSTSSRLPGAGVGARPVVVYLVNQYPAVTHTFIKREILALENLGIEVVRVAVRPGAALVDPGDLIEAERTTHLARSPSWLLKAALLGVVVRPRRFAAALSSAMRLMRRSDRPPLIHLLYLVEAFGVAAKVRESGANHIHAHFGTNSAEIALLASKLSGVSYSFTVHGYDEYDRPEFIGLRAKIRAASFVAAVSYYGRSQLYRWCDKADQNKIRLVRCGLERQFHHGTEEVPCDSARLLCVGRLCREKGQDVLVRAAAMIAAAGRRFELVLVGDGEARQDLEALVAELGLWGTVRLAGWLSSVEVRREMLAARALVVGSLAENLPVVIMEAMALRRPVIATQIAGIPELVIPGQTGWLVPASSVEALAEAMTACLDASPAELLEMGRSGRERVLAFHDVDREAKRLSDLFPRDAVLPQQMPAAIDDALRRPRAPQMTGN